MKYYRHSVNTSEFHFTFHRKPTQTTTAIKNECSAAAAAFPTNFARAKFFN